ncbi:capping complex subunit for YIEGIA [Paenibacillus sp. MMO-177]|uniref:capping complex subunit for YIEGIA n=1 Tax=Paenibacillus sp. MMO-177 TaxID=3081289 RepID=UPI003018BA63
MAKIIAVVATRHEKVGGGAPIFIEQDEKAMQQTAFLLEKILDASAHDLKNGTIIIVNHH